VTAVLTIVVHIALSFESSIRSRIVRNTVAAEAAAVWRDYGVALDFGDGARPQLCIAAFVDRAAPRVESALPVLGATFVPDDPANPPPPVRIAFDRIDDFAAPSASASPILHDYAVGTAIGRVLAHEIGHILLGAPGYHDDHGLMRSSFLSNDFLPWDRSRYRLAARSVARLRARVPALSAAADAPGCRAR